MANVSRLAMSPSLGSFSRSTWLPIADPSPTLSVADYARQALAAGPDVIAKGAAVVRPEHDGTMRTLKEGTNGFTCLIMGTDRMCADKNSM